MLFPSRNLLAATSRSRNEERSLQDDTTKEHARMSTQLCAATLHCLLLCHPEGRLCGLKDHSPLAALPCFLARQYPLSCRSLWRVPLHRDREVAASTLVLDLHFPDLCRILHTIYCSNSGFKPHSNIDFHPFFTDFMLFFAHSDYLILS